MQTSSVARLSVLVSCWILACGARTSSPTTAPIQAPSVFSERDAAIESDCPSLVGEPQSLFAGRLELALPVGISPLIERAPGQMSVRDQTATCAAGRIVASIVVIEQPDDDPTWPISFVRDQLLDALALPNGLEIATHDEDDAARRMTSVITVPADPEQGRERRTRMLLALRGGAGRIYAVTFESSAEQFEALLPSFEASLASMSIPE
jgi:hypothetical protein